MALVNGMAISDGTKTKHQHFDIIFRTHIAIARAVINHNSWTKPHYTYIDINAGAGNVQYPDGTSGETSGLMAVRRLASQSTTDNPFRYRAYLIDIQADNCAALCRADAIQNNPSVQVVCGDNNAVLPTLRVDKWSVGLLFNDPNNLIPDLDMLTLLARQDEYRRIDFLIHMSAANYKRDRRANGRDYLEDRLLSIKKYWYIQEPHDKHQKTFLLGANWSGLDKFKKDLKFTDMRTDVGRAYFDRINLTKEERFLSLQAGLSIEPMTNTCLTPNTGRSAPRLSSEAEASVNGATSGA